jgi:hypothetical protein
MAHRWVSGVFGVFLVAMAAAIGVYSDRSTGPVVAALLLAGLGLDALVSAIRNRRSLLSRLGPLP